MADAKLNSSGQLVSEAQTGTEPIVVASRTLVSNLNAELLNDVKEEKMLRTDTARTLSSTLTVGDDGIIQVSGTGKVKVGNFNLKQIGDVLSFSYEV